MSAVIEPLSMFRGLALASLLLAGSACSSSEATADAGATCTPVNVSFEADVLPIFQQSCGQSSCHGDPSATRVFLGSTRASAAANALVHSRIVDVPSQTAPSLALVKPHDPENSFLMRKMDGDFSGIAGQCAGGDCGDRMPQGNPPLEPCARDTVRIWIREGAADN